MIQQLFCDRYFEEGRWLLAALSGKVEAITSWVTIRRANKIARLRDNHTFYSFSSYLSDLGPGCNKQTCRRHLDSVQADAATWSGVEYQILF